MDGGDDSVQRQSTIWIGGRQVRTFRARPGTNCAVPPAVRAAAQEQIERHFKLGAPIGQPGAFGYAVRATALRPRKDRPSEVAVKVISKVAGRAIPSAAPSAPSPSLSAPRRAAAGSHRSLRPSSTAPSSARPACRRRSRHGRCSLAGRLLTALRRPGCGVPFCVQNFRDEVDLMAQMDHPNIIKLYAVGARPRACYLRRPPPPR